MSKPVDFLTASGEEFRYAFIASPYDTWYEFVMSAVIPSVAAAAEAKVRGECADTLRDMESASHGYRRSSEEWQRRAERAEAERDAAIRQRNEKQATIGLLRVANQEWQVKLADAKREGAYEALTKLAEWWSEVESHTAHSFTVAKNVRSFRDRDYAPTPARSVTLGEHKVKIVRGDARFCYATQGFGGSWTLHKNLAGVFNEVAPYEPTVDEMMALFALLKGDGDA
jgi:hypothetical protein